MKGEMPQDVYESIAPVVEYEARKFISEHSLPRHVTAGDVEQDAWEGALIAWRDFDEARGCGFESYAKQRIRGQVKDSYRSCVKWREGRDAPAASFEHKHEIDEKSDGVRQSASNQIEAKEILEQLKENRNGLLTAREHEVFCMRFFDSMDYPLIARKLGVSEEVCRWHIFNARKKITNKYADLSDMSFVKDSING